MVVGVALAYLVAYVRLKKNGRYSLAHLQLFRILAIVAILTIILFPLVETSSASDQDFVKVLIGVTVQLLAFGGVIIGIAPTLYQRSTMDDEQTRHLIAQSRSSAIVALLTIVVPLVIELFQLRVLEGAFVFAIPSYPVLMLLSPLTFALEFSMILLGFGFLVLSIFQVYQIRP